MRNIIFSLIILSSLSLRADEPVLIDSLEVQQLILEQVQYYDSIDQTFDYKYGEVSLKDEIGIIHVPSNFKYISGIESKRLLEELWGNPEGSESLGMLLPKELSPASPSTYGITIDYIEEGYVSDEDAEDIDYEDLLEDLKEDAEAENEARVDAGYETIELVGWAQAPFYDKENKKLHWAKEYRFGDSESTTLNYNIRVLGRKGYMQLNVIASIDQLEDVNAELDNILASVEFNKGNTYDEFDPEIDEVAAYGIGALVAGKVLAKVGFFGLILKFWKLLAIGVVAAFGFAKKFLFGSKE